MQFSSLINQLPKAKTHLSLVRNKQIPHAQLFVSAPGSGALALATSYAQYILCTNQGIDDSCGICQSCKLCQGFSHPDLHFAYPFLTNKTEKIATCSDVFPQFVQAFSENTYLSLPDWLEYLQLSGKKANIPIAACHEIMHKLSLKPFAGGYQILILWLPELLGKSANSLLKLLEEPPAKTLFLLVTDNKSALLSTLTSRCRQIDIPKPNPKSLPLFLTNQGFEASQAQDLGLLADGNLAHLKNLIAAENTDQEGFAAWMRDCYHMKATGLTEFATSFTKMNRNKQELFFQYAISSVRSTLLYLSGAPELIRLKPAEQAFIAQFSSTINLEKAQMIVLELEKALSQLNKNAQVKILLLAVSLHIYEIFKQV